MWLLLALCGLTLAGEKDEEKRKIRYDFSAAEISGNLGAPSSFGATPGGAQDIHFARMLVGRGEIPLPEAFTPEGLFSEHDLPLPESDCDQLLCVSAAAAPVSLPEVPTATQLVQIGFASGLDPASYRRPPLNLIAVVDQSGSMTGRPIELVRTALLEVVDELRPEDQLSIVVYGSSVVTHLEPLSGGAKDRARSSIQAIGIAGATNMEAGLKEGFALARATRSSFDGTTRVLLFTDERPNVGATHAGSFMSMARGGSRDGIGLTTFGVGAQFGAELAATISSVRGGNLFFFSDVESVQTKVESEFDFMFSELAYDMVLDVDPGRGFEIAGLHGVPGHAVEWTADGGIKLEVATVFLSQKKGGIFVSLSPTGGPARGPVADVSLSYTTRDVGSVSSSLSPSGVAGAVGLERGELLIDLATTVKQATILHHHHNRTDDAWQLVHALNARLRDADEPSVNAELVWLGELEQTLAMRAGRAGEPVAAGRRHPVSGLPAGR